MNNEFAHIYNTGELRFKYAKGMRDIIGKEIHSYHEIFFFINGDATFISEKGKVLLRPDTAVIIPKETFHQFTVLGKEQDYVRCVYNFTEVNELDSLLTEVCSGVRLISNVGVTDIFNELRHLTAETIADTERNILLKANFARLLVAISKSKESERGYSDFSPITRKVIEIIASDYTADLSAARIAKTMRISISHLQHVFKSDMHVSLHRYVIEKRLTYASSLISIGTNATDAALAAGFGDYSGFYKQYKMYFGHAPSEKK